MAILILRRFGCVMPIPAHFGEVFGGFYPLSVVWYCRDPQKAHPWPETRDLAYRSFRSVKKYDLGTRWRKQKKERKKRNSEIWQVTYVPRPPTLRYPHQICHVGWGPGRSQPCQVSSKLVNGFRLPEGSKSAIFLYLALWLIQQVRATAQPVIQQEAHQEMRQRTWTVLRWTHTHTTKYNRLPINIKLWHRHSPQHV